MKKLNVGIDYSFLEGLFAGSVEFFRDVRSNIFVYGGDRSIPSYFGGTLVVINVIVYLICTFTGDLLYNIGELDAVAVLRYGEYGRILSSTFLHAGIEHLFNNMVILFFLGAMIEKVTGHLQFLILYLLSGIGANICSLIYKVIAMERIAALHGSGRCGIC